MGETFQVPECKISWHQSMLGNLYYDEEKIRKCTETDLTNLWSVGYDFIKAGANMNKAQTGCQCKTNMRYSKIIFNAFYLLRLSYKHYTERNISVIFKN